MDIHRKMKRVVKSRIDYVMITKNDSNMIKSMWVDEEKCTDMDSDHTLIYVKINIEKWRYKKQRKNKVRNKGEINTYWKTRTMESL